MKAMLPAFLFNQTYSDMTVIGRRGGLAHGRNVRARQAAPATGAGPDDPVPRPETAAEAIAICKSVGQIIGRRPTSTYAGGVHVRFAVPPNAGFFAEIAPNSAQFGTRVAVICWF